MRFDRALKRISLQTKEVDTAVDEVCSTPDVSTVQTDLETRGFVVSLLNSINKQLQEISSQRLKSLDELQLLAIELGTMVASHLIREKITAGEFDLTRIMSLAIDELLPAEQVEVRAHPEDITALCSATDTEQIPSCLEFVEDIELPRGSCLVSSGHRRLLFDLDTRLANVRDTLLQGVEHARIVQQEAS